MGSQFRPPHSGHNQHLCYFANLGMHQRREAQYKKLVRGGKYVCKKCGRVAAKPRNLCKPVKL
ncbi:MAG: hypothetical protein PVG93_05845 [Phycisphaerales bacterium]